MKLAEKSKIHIASLPRNITRQTDPEIGGFSPNPTSMPSTRARTRSSGPITTTPEIEMPIKLTREYPDKKASLAVDQGLVEEALPKATPRVTKVQTRRSSQYDAISKREQDLRDKELAKIRQEYREAEAKQEGIESHRPLLSYDSLAMPYKAINSADTKNQLSPSILTNYIYYSQPIKAPTARKDPPQRLKQPELGLDITPNLSSAKVVTQRLKRYGLSITEDLVDDLLSLPEEEFSREELLEGLEKMKELTGGDFSSTQTPYIETFEFLYVVPPNSMI